MLRTKSVRKNLMSPSRQYDICIFYCDLEIDVKWGRTFFIEHNEEEYKIESDLMFDF